MITELPRDHGCVCIVRLSKAKPGTDEAAREMHQEIKLALDAYTWHAVRPAVVLPYESVQVLRAGHKVTCVTAYLVMSY